MAKSTLNPLRGGRAERLALMVRAKGATQEELAAVGGTTPANKYRLAEIAAAAGGKLVETEGRGGVTRYRVVAA